MASSSNSSSLNRGRLIGLGVASALIAYGVEMQRHPPIPHYDPPWIEIARTDSGVLLADTNGVDAGNAFNGAVFMKFERTRPKSIPGADRPMAAVVGTQVVDCTSKTREMENAAALDSAGQPLVELNELKGHREPLGEGGALLCGVIRRAWTVRSPERLVVDRLIRQEITRTSMEVYNITKAPCENASLGSGIVPILLFKVGRETRIGDTVSMPVIYLALGVSRTAGSGAFTFDSSARFETFIFRVVDHPRQVPSIVCESIPWNHVLATEFDRNRDQLDANSRAEWDSVYRHTPADVTLRNVAAMMH